VRHGKDSERCSGREVLAQAKASVAKAKTVDELRQAQAVLLPLEFDLSLEQTAEAIGVSIGWACRLRTQFIRDGGQRREAKLPRGGRRRENMTPKEEVAFLAPFFEKAAACQTASKTACPPISVQF